MARRSIITLFSALVSLPLAGCYIFGFGVARAVPAGPGGPPNSQPTAVIPQIRLEYGGQSFNPTQYFYVWATGNSAMLGSGAAAPGLGGTLLQAPVGAAINIVVGPGGTPAVVWVAELDGSGTPSRPATLTPSTAIIPYTVNTSGHYQLQVTVEWTYQNQVTGIFELEVAP